MKKPAKIFSKVSFSHGNLRQRRVLSVLEIYIQNTADHDLYGGLAELAVDTLNLRRQCAADWATLSQIKPSDMPKWWRAGAFEPEAAQALIDAGIGLALAKRSCGEKGEEIDTFAYHVSMGRMSVSQVVERIHN